MLRLLFVVASVLAVLGGATAGSPSQQAAAALVSVTLLAHHVVAQRGLRHGPAAGRVPRGVRLLGSLDR